MNSEKEMVHDKGAGMQMPGRLTIRSSRSRARVPWSVAHAAAVLLVVWGAGRVVSAETEAEPSREYKIKAAFMYHFIPFVSGWDFERKGEQGEADDSGADVPILIGVVGRDPFQGAFAPLSDRRVHGRRIQVKLFGGLSPSEDEGEPAERHPHLDEIRKCDLLFICASERHHIDVLLASIRREPILTVADMPGFLERGGTINFVMEKTKVKFEINTAGARRATLRLRSQLLRLATRVIDEDEVEER